MNRASLTVNSVRVKNRTKLHDLWLVINGSHFKNSHRTNQQAMLKKHLAKAIHVGDMHNYCVTHLPSVEQITTIINELQLSLK
jgi:hypothetical protein